MHACDPIVTASIFCDRRLDQVVHRAIAPALKRLRAEYPQVDWAVWWVRYARNGEHVKVRVHGPADRTGDVQRVLKETVDAFLDSLPPADGDEARRSRPSIPPIDIDDEATTDYPDRSLRWTRYRRSHVSFGPKSLLSNDEYANRIAAALARGAALVLETTALDDQGRIPGTARQHAVLRGLITGLGASGFTPAERVEYLAYHRDWLVRFNTPDDAGELKVQAGLDRQVNRMGKAVEQLARTVAAHWGARADSEADLVEVYWKDAVAGLCTWAEGLQGSGPSPDPYTENRAFPLVFKAFHGLANQAGLDMLNEALLHHLLLRVAEVQSPSPSTGPGELQAAEAYA